MVIEYETIMKYTLMVIMALGLASVPLAYADDDDDGGGFMVWLANMVQNIEQTLFNVESDIEALETRFDNLETTISGLQIIGNFTDVQLRLGGIQNMTLDVNNRTSQLILDIDELQQMVDIIENTTTP